MASNKKYDLEDRTFHFTQNVRDYVDDLPCRITNTEIGKQLIRSAGSVGANYIEANESLSKKDFIMRIKICRKEAKGPKNGFRDLKSYLISDSEELMRIFGAIVQKTKI